MAPQGLNPSEHREIILSDHDDLIVQKLKTANMSDVVADHEKRVRTLENQQSEWKGGIKIWGIFTLIFQLLLNIIQTYLATRAHS